MLRLLLLLSCLLLAGFTSAQSLTVGSKMDSEGRLLGEIFAQKLEADGFQVQRQLGLGSTSVTWQALQGGDIDIYPEYTGTLALSLLGLETTLPRAELNEQLQSFGLKALPSLGFNNTYALTLQASQAQEKGIQSISDLAGHEDLRLGLSHEFIQRDDGWPGLKEVYELPFTPRGVEHGLAYEAIQAGRIDITDAYSTDGDLERFNLILLEDDRDYFPEYLALPLIRADLPLAVQASLEELAGHLNETRMQALNARISSQEAGFTEVADQFLRDEGLIADEQREFSGRKWDKLGVNLLEHLQLTLLALFLACLVGLPLAILVYRSPRISQAVLYVAGLLQTIPSIALLALMIPLFGIGFLPAIIALFLYSLLPILRAAVTSLLTVNPLLVKVSLGMGMTRSEQLKYILLPLAAPNLLVGIKTAAIINIGTATLAAFIGAGGLGEPIVTGLALNDHTLVLYGAIPAALMAIVTELVFNLAERRWIPAHLRGIQSQ
ncbi:glycine betaine ABC transporter substrate-binding protein [Marinospirillum sp.]|uniref:glycine betaine ABC transporter substrate-binding protein n=1 Tax=Marinospirillum sp. TaxID=2183934 RepID=UPI002870A62F|nr:glycine betaine ABC transporter substrate-binding protein [Marinospirillum sp.]MDR9467737.1 glycine betaine ABC transporter substrate-binding protein [Marinospirillum sp.]